MVQSLCYQHPQIYSHLQTIQNKMKTPTNSKSKFEKIRSVLMTIAKFIMILISLYFFVCSLTFLSDSFRLLGGKNIGAFFADSELLNNPVVGVMIGVLVTVLVQSSSTSTTIIVGLVATDVPVRTAIPMIMGANIGTSVTNTIVSFTQISNRDEFKRAFSAATVHDMFNWLTVILLVIVEVITSSISVGYLEFVTGKMVEHLSNEESNSTRSKPPDFLKVITKPFTKTIIQLDKKILKGWASNDPDFDNVTSVMKSHCKEGNCTYLFYGLSAEGADIGDVGAGVILLVLSLVMLCGCLIGLVKLLNSILGEKVKDIISTFVNKDIPIKGLGWLTGYLAMLVGAGLTVLVQSSSVFTSTLTPLAGTGLVTLERVYPMTLGSNIGTTTTSLLAALSVTEHGKEALQIALVHLMFNINGILLFYPIPWLRFPVFMADKLGKVTSKYRWFSVAYLLLMFFVFPAFIFGLSLAGSVAMYIVLVPVAIIIIFITLISVFQRKCPQLLPQKLQDWKFLPSPLRSLEPYDRIIEKLNCVKSCKFKQGVNQNQENQNNGNLNQAYEFDVK